MKKTRAASGEPQDRTAGLKQGTGDRRGSGAGCDKEERAPGKNDRFYHTFFDLAPDPMAITDLDDGRLIDVNQAFVEWSCRSRNALIGRTARELSIWVDDETRDAILDELERSGSVDNIQVDVRKGNGVLRQTLLSGKRIETGGKRYFLSVARDVTEYKQAEKAFKESEERFRDLFDNAVEGVYHTTPEGRIADANMAYARMFGYDSPEEAVSDVTDIASQLYVNADDRTKVVGILKEKGCLDNFECPMRRKDGSVFWVVINARLSRLHDGTPCFEGFVVDITKRKEAEEALRESERELKEAQEIAHLGHWIWDVKTGEVEWSEEVFKIFQLDPGTFTPRIDSILALSPWSEDHERDKELIRKAMESHEKGSYEQRFLRPDSSVGYYLSTFQGRYDDSDDLVSIVGTVQDITERKKAEEEREKLIIELKEAISRVKTLSGLLPICSSCKKIRNDKGYWEQMEMYIRDHSEAEFSHGICPECAAKLYPHLQKKK